MDGGGGGGWRRGGGGVGFFFQAEDGIRDRLVTGVQTCALPISAWDSEEQGLIGSTEWVEHHAAELDQHAVAYINTDGNSQIGRASCRERV